MIKVGDKVKLIDKFYEHEAFRSDSRWIRKQIASLKGKLFKVTAILFGRAHTATDIIYTIPIELLEKIEELPKKTGFDEIENLIEAFAGLVKPIVEMGKLTKQGMSLQEAIESMSKHRYTDEQIAEAEQIIGKIVASLPDWDTFFFRRNGSETMLYAGGNANKQNSAKCRETDEYNQTIGRMIALCNHTGHKRPEWL